LNLQFIIAKNNILLKEK